MRSSIFVIAALVLAACGPSQNTPDGGSAGGGAGGGSGGGAGGGSGGGAGGGSGSYTWGGDCDTPLDAAFSDSWNHSLAATYATSLGDPAHRVRDVITEPGVAARLRGRFTYGTVDKDLEDEVVELWFRRCPDWESWGTFTTSSDGVVWADVPDDIPVGTYAVRYMVQGDGTHADGFIAVWPPGTQAIVTDIDGTLTTSDWELFQDVATGDTAEMYTDADTAMKKWAGKDYRILYLSGRVQWINKYSRDWLSRFDFPPGPMYLTESGLQALPTETAVQEFKAGVIADLKDRVGVEFVAAYGNATTDIGAYAATNIPKEDTWIIGSNAGADGTQDTGADYTAHLTVIDGYPDAMQP